MFPAGVLIIFRSYIGEVRRYTKNKKVYSYKIRLIITGNTPVDKKKMVASSLISKLKSKTEL